MALYLITCPSANSLGIYYLPLTLLAHETGRPLDVAESTLSGLESVGFVVWDRDAEMVWIPEMARHQIGDTLGPNDKRYKWVLAELKRLKGRLADLFYLRYQDAYCLPPVAPKAHPSPIEGVPPLAGSPFDAQSHSQSHSQGQSHRHCQGDPSPESAVAVRAEPTRPDNPKPALSEIRTVSGPPQALPTQPRGAQEPQVPILRTREAVLAMPINERARWYLANQHQFFGGAADWAQPETWPEVLAPIQAFHEAGGLRPPRLHGYNRDYAVKHVIEHYAVGYTLEELLVVYRDVVTSDYYLERKLKGHKPHASWVTAGVLQRQLEVESDGSAQFELARRQLEREKAAKAARLVAEVEHTQSLVTDDDDEWDMPAAAQLGSSPASRLLTGSGK